MKALKVVTAIETERMRNLKKIAVTSLSFRVIKAPCCETKIEDIRI